MQSVNKAYRSGRSFSAIGVRLVDKLVSDYGIMPLPRVP